MRKAISDMKRTTIILCAALCAAGCDSGSTEATQERVEETTRDLARQAGKLGRDAKERGERLLFRGKELGEWTLDEMRELGAQLAAEYGDDINQGGAVVNELLVKIARDPSDGVTSIEKAGRIVVLMIPFIGPTKRYADARALFKVGSELPDPAKKQEARRECLVACAEAGLDIGTLGLVGGRIDTVATGVDRVLTALKLSRNVNALVGDDLKTFDDLLDQVLESEAIRSGLDAALAVDLARVVPERGTEERESVE